MEFVIATREGSGKVDRKKEEVIVEIMDSIGLLSFMHDAAHKAISTLESSCTTAFSLLSDKAIEALEKGYFGRQIKLYRQSLAGELLQEYTQIDPIGLLLGNMTVEGIEKASVSLQRKTSGSIEEVLHEKYPLLKEYRNTIERNTICAYREFLEHLEERREEISVKLLSGRKFHQVLGISTGGGDMHRHGKCVMGIETDAGSFFYKPHDCGPDIVFERIVERWFSDCTLAPKVIDGDGYAFVSTLRKEPVSSKAEIASYYYNFGMLTALFHALGSSDMHQENLLACGERPSAIDLETFLSIRGKTEETKDISGVMPQEMHQSVFRIGILPFRSYGVGFISALYPNRIANDCIPELDGRKYSVEGYEDEFSKGFSEGYDIMLSHREEIKGIIEEHASSTIRLLFKNTAFYSLLLGYLYMPEHLKSDEGRQRVYSMLCSPYTSSGTDVDEDIVKYEWECLQEGDVPYFCTSIDGYDICGADTNRVIRKGYFEQNVIDSEHQLLDRLSPEEKHFELELIRIAFSHAAPDEPEETEEMVIRDAISSEKTIGGAIADIYDDLMKDRITGLDGESLWYSSACQNAGIMVPLKAVIYSELGLFCSSLSSSGLLPDKKEVAEREAVNCAELALESIGRWKAIPVDANTSYIPTGLYNGIGNIILSSHYASSLGFDGFEKVEREVLKSLEERKLYRFGKSSVSEGAAGLLIALSVSQSTLDDGLEECVHYCADSVLSSLPKDGADFFVGNAGSGAALAAAYALTGRECYAEGALKAFARVEEAYSENLGGWPMGKSRKRPIAPRAPYDAGIYLAAEFAKDRLGGCEGFEVIDVVSSLAKKGLLGKERLDHKDSLSNGNALSVLALVRMGENDKAGRIVDSMINRREAKGSFTITKAGIRSFFDPSLVLGTTGIGLAMIAYICIGREQRGMDLKSCIVR